MPPPEILLLALALSADAFSVAAVLGLRYRQPRQVFRVSFHFGLFQALLPLAGALLGGFMLTHIERWDHWIAFGLLALLGIRMMRSGVRGSGQRTESVDLTRGLSLVGFSLAVSIDAFAAGITLPAVGAPIALSVVLFGVVTAMASLVAIALARSVAGRLGSRVEVAAGVVLIGLGLKILADHLNLI
ncbi:MAG: manganese efflux pump [Vicinamibacteria bacterium]|nr:manganese efflux pump [Vicinamibacteria bacterium]